MKKAIVASVFFGLGILLFSSCAGLKGRSQQPLPGSNVQARDYFTDGFSGAHIGNTGKRSYVIRDGNNNVIHSMDLASPWRMYNEDGTQIAAVSDTNARPYKIYDSQDRLIWEEIVHTWSDPSTGRAGSLLTDPPFTDVRIENGALHVYDTTDIDRDDGRSVTFKSVQPFSDKNRRGFICSFRVGVLKGYRGSGCSWAHVMIQDEKNYIMVHRGHDDYDTGDNRFAALTINNDNIYDTRDDSLLQPDGYSTMDIRIVNLPDRFEYWVNGKKIIDDKKYYVDFDESKMFILLQGWRWNWKGPLDARFENIRFEPVQ